MIGKFPSMATGIVPFLSKTGKFSFTVQLSNAGLRHLHGSPTRHCHTLRKLKGIWQTEEGYATGKCTEGAITKPYLNSYGTQKLRRTPTNTDRGAPGATNRAASTSPAATCGWMSPPFGKKLLASTP